MGGVRADKGIAHRWGMGGEAEGPGWRQWASRNTFVGSGCGLSPLRCLRLLHRLSETSFAQILPGQSGGFRSALGTPLGAGPIYGLEV